MHQAGAIQAVIVKPAGFLAPQWVGAKTGPVFDDIEMVRRCAFRHLHITVQPFQRPNRGIVAQNHGGRLHHLDDGGHQRLTPPLHAGGGDLYHANAAEAVNNHTGQTIALAVYQTITGLIEQALAQRQRDVQTMHQQGFGDGMVPVTAHQAGADQRMGVDVAVAQKLTLVVNDFHILARFIGAEGATRGIHLIAEHPDVTSPQAAGLFLLET